MELNSNENIFVKCVFNAFVLELEQPFHFHITYYVMKNCDMGLWVSIYIGFEFERCRV